MVGRRREEEGWSDEGMGGSLTALNYSREDILVLVTQAERMVRGRRRRTKAGVPERPISAAIARREERTSDPEGASLVPIRGPRIILRHEDVKRE